MLETSNDTPLPQEVIENPSPSEVIEDEGIPLDDLITDILGEDEVAATKVVKEEEKKAPSVDDLPVHNVKVEESPFRASEGKSKASVSLPSDTYKASEHVLTSLPSIQVTDNDEWASTLSDGHLNEVFNGTGYSRFAQPDGQFTNLLRTPGNLSLNGAYAGQARNSNNELTGERALLGVMNYMKLGNIYMAPLWNSGFWIWVKPPTEGALIDLMALLRTEKVRVGRATYGLAYSAITGVTMKYVVEFVKAHIYSTSINNKEIAIESIDKYISINDLDALLLSIICSMHPTGFDYKRSCVVDPVVCNHLATGIIDPNKILFVNRRALSEQMLGHMSNRKSNSMSLKEVENYQRQLGSRNVRVMDYVTHGDRRISFELKTPTIEKSIQSTDAWVADVETTADRILSKDATDRQRTLLIEQHAKATTMRQYSNYVDNIVYGENTRIEDNESIRKVLNALSADDNLSREFNKNVTEIINASTIASVGIPTFNCEGCGKEAHSRKGHGVDYENLIPLDILSIFFDLARVKMDIVNRR